MNKPTTMLVKIFLLGICLAGCAIRQSTMVVNPDSVLPGSAVTRNGEKVNLLGTALEIGQPLPPTDLVNARTMGAVNFAAYAGKVLMVSVVPSVDTKVCEAQTHYLGEEGDKLPASVQRVTISRDTPFAQVRFAREAKLDDLIYFSDYKQGAFGRATGLLVEGSLLLARAVILVDKGGVVRYIQVVPELTNLPDMEKAFVKATELANQP